MIAMSFREATPSGWALRVRANSLIARATPYSCSTVPKRTDGQSGTRRPGISIHWLPVSLASATEPRPALSAEGQALVKEIDESRRWPLEELRQVAAGGFELAAKNRLV
jgi:hypothetical protein